MIIVQLKGGLGNQLFQYAAGLSLARHHSVPVKVDTTELKHPDQQIGTAREYELQHILAPPEIASLEEVTNLTRQPLLVKYAHKLLPSYRRTIYNEKQFTFDPDFFNAGRHIYLKGYRQSELYFSWLSNEIRKNFQLQPALTAAVAAFEPRLKGVESVAVHIRRGDYDNKVVNNYHGTLPDAYYRAAVKLFSSKLDNPQFFVFSDNISWAKEHLELGDRAHFVSGSVSRTHYEDFFLMSRCKHNIIANSSFSWWAGWLNPNPGKTVVAPRQWFNNAPYDTKDLIPQGWIQL